MKPMASLLAVFIATTSIALAESEKGGNSRIYIEEPLPVVTGEPNPILTSEPIIDPISEGTENPEVQITSLPETNPEVISEIDGSSPEIMPILAEDTSCLPPADSEFYTNMPSLDGSPETIDANTENSDTTSAEVVSMDVPMVATNLDIHIPLAKLLSMTDSSDICAYLKYVGEDENGDLIWKLQKYVQK